MFTAGPTGVHTGMDTSPTELQAEKKGGHVGRPFASHLRLRSSAHKKCLCCSITNK